MTNTCTGYIISFARPAEVIILNENRVVKARDEVETKSLVNRLSRIEGQVKGIKRMLESDICCVDILVQSSAVNAAINSFNKELISSYIKNTISDDLKHDKNDSVDELVTVLQRLMK